MTHNTTTHRGAPAIGPRHEPLKLAIPKVRRLFDAERLIDVCTMDAKGFSRYATRYDLEGEDRFFYHQDNGSKILAVAHLDSVQGHNTCSVVDTAGGPLAVSGALDDRLGAYVILELLPALGITVDWLLTTDEEIGASTAGAFDTDKEYNWIIQFDRGGTDVVMYDYETRELVDLVEDSGAKVGIGSYSDICRLQHLGVSAFNWGVGYEDYHGARSHAWLEDTFRMVARFMRFHEANAETKLVHEPRAIGSWWGDDDDDLAHETEEEAFLEWLDERGEMDRFTDNHLFYAWQDGRGDEYLDENFPLSRGA